LQDAEIVAPTDFCNQWLQFWLIPVGSIELPHIEHVALGEPGNAREFLPQVFRQSGGSRITMRSIGLADNYQTTDIPIQVNQFRVYCLEGNVLCGADALLDLGQKQWIVLRNDILLLHSRDPGKSATGGCTFEISRTTGASF